MSRAHARVVEFVKSPAARAVTTHSVRGTSSVTDQVSGGDGTSYPISEPSNVPQTGTVLSVVQGNNADLVAHIAPLYIPDGAFVRDVTWGRGAFWNGVDTSRFTVQGSDIADHIGGHNGVIKADFCKLPDESASADLVVLDPPYIHNPGKHVTDSRYNNKGTTTGMYHRDIRALYLRGMTEALRVVRPGGQLWVKGKDEVESGRQCWSHAEIREDAESLGFYARDMFILVPTSRTSMNRWSTQKHARKVHSFMWVFDLPVPKSKRALKPKPKTELTTEPKPKPKTETTANPEPDDRDGHTPVPTTVEEARDLLISLKERSGLGWPRFADAMGRSRSTVWDWGKHRPIPEAVWVEIAKFGDELGKEASV